MSINCLIQHIQYTNIIFKYPKPIRSNIKYARTVLFFTRHAETAE